MVLNIFQALQLTGKNLKFHGDLLTSDNLLYLDLGKVKMIADVYLNDNHLGILWKPPFQIDIT